MEEMKDDISTLYSLTHYNHNGKLLRLLNAALELSDDADVESKVTECIQMITSLKIYLLDHCSPPTELVKRIEEDTMAEPWSEHQQNNLILFRFITDTMNSNTSAQFIRSIAEISKAERILEIGLFTGLSAAIFCSSRFAKQVTSLEIEPFLINFAKIRFAGTDEEKKLRIIEGSAMDSLKKLKADNETFDLVFIDADKANYLEYYKFIMDNDIIGSGSVMLVGNTLWRAEPYSREQRSDSGQKIEEFNSFVQKDERVTKVILPIGDGITVVCRN